MDEPGPADPPRAMRLSLNRTMVAGGQVTWPEFLDLAARYGYDGVDLPRLTELANDPVELTVERLSAHRLVAGPAIMPVRFAVEREVFDDGFAQLEGYAALAEAVGCQDLLAILPASSEVAKVELRRLVVDRLRACAEVLANHGLRLAVEFYGPLHMRQLHRYPFVFSLGETLEVVGECGTNVGLLLDSWHWHHSSATREDIVAAGDAVFVVQVADAADLAPELVRDMERLVPGEGVVDLPAFFSALVEVGYDGFVSPEVFGPRLAEVSPDDGARLAHESIRAAMTAGAAQLTSSRVSPAGSS